MICVPNFPGDDDKRLFDMQHSCYSKALWMIVEAARERFVDAESVMRCSSPISVQVHALRAIDHRTVQDMHDLVAAWYRFKKRTERLFPFDYDLTEDWLRFARADAVALSKSADFVTGVLDACIYANTEIGYAGERRAQAIQQTRYISMFQYRLPRFDLEFEITSTSENENT